SIGGHDFPVLLDTGSSDLWVISSDCTAADCLGIATYQTTPTLSLTDTPFKLGYLMGSVSGTVGYETITLGNYQICSQVFAVADQATDLSLSATGYSGILGLSFPAAASISTTSGISLVQNLFSAFYDDSKKYFAFKLGRDDDRTEPDDSSFTIGQLDEEVLQSIGHNLSGDIQFDEMPVVARSDGVYDYWKVPLLSLTIDSQPLQLSPSRVPEASSPLAVLDTGTTLILGPTLDVENFWGSFGNGTTRKNVWSQWEVRCERAARIGFLLGKEGHEYVVDPQDISWSGSRSGDGWCLGGIQANDQVNSADWILGDVFLRVFPFSCISSRLPQNVYVKHQVPTTSQPAVVGLLQATNADSAMARFKEQRGQDSAPPIQIRSAVHYRRRYKFTPIVLLTITWAIGFIGGSIGRLLFQRIGRCLGIRRKYMSHNTANPEVRVYSR
ncbi:acid protease, partial [Gloeophyllum trabeum ATCC 11539]